VVAATAMAVGLAGPAGAARRRVTPRLLVLSAFRPSLTGPGQSGAAPRRAVTDGTGHTFIWLDSAAATGGTGPHRIGPVHAQRTTEAALDAFRCGTATAISGIVFSGVAGSTRFIGDVAVPNRWSDDHGASWIAVDPAMFAVARQLRRPDRPARTGQPAPGRPVRCDLNSIRTVHRTRSRKSVWARRHHHRSVRRARLPVRAVRRRHFGCRVCRAGPGPAPDALGF